MRLPRDPLSASQALITAVFSLTRQLIQLGYWPRARMIHTSAEAQGQHPAEPGARGRRSGGALTEPRPATAA
jgi:hypothetical protein